MLASIEVVTQPRRRALAAFQAARAAADDANSTRGVSFARALQVSTFRSDAWPPQVPGRVAVMIWAEDVGHLDAARETIGTRLHDGAAEVWRAVLEPVRVHGSWRGFVPACSAAAPLKLQEPSVVMIHGVLRARYVRRFARDNARIVTQLATAPGYLGGLGMADTLFTTTSFSCWRTAKHAQTFAFGAGRHRSSYQVDLAEKRHATEFFVRFRPLSSVGSIDGVDPLERVLSVD